jgi:hypothetical protein
MILPHYSYLLAGLIPQAQVKICPDLAHGLCSSTMSSSRATLRPSSPSHNEVTRSSRPRARRRDHTWPQPPELAQFSTDTLLAEAVSWTPTAVDALALCKGRASCLR